MEMDVPYIVGGAIVRRKFTAGGKTYTRGMRVSAADVLSWPNRRMLKSAGYLELFPCPESLPEPKRARGKETGGA